MSDETVQRAHDAARAIIGEAGHIDGMVLVCEINGQGLVVAFDDEGHPDLNRHLVRVLRGAADRIEALGMEPFE
jgi:hypothetical protein